MLKLAIFGACVAVVACHDILIGTNLTGTKIFDETRQASPAFWKQMENVTISANDTDVIRGIIVTDLRPDKEGDVKIVDGGEGQKSVTLELKSPTLLRGFDFHIEVYATPDDHMKGVPIQKDDAPLHPSQTRLRRKPEDFHNNFDVKLTPPVTTETDLGIKARHPLSSDTTINNERKSNNPKQVNEDKLKTNISETKSDNLNDTDYKKQEGIDTVDSLRHVRKADEEDKLDAPKTNQHHHVKDIGSILPASQHPIVTLKQETKDTFNTKGIDTDLRTTKTSDAENTDVKRQARDADAKKDSNMKTTEKNVINNEHVTDAPYTTTMKYNFKHFDDSERQENPSSEDSDKMHNIKAFLPPRGFGTTEASTLPVTLTKERAVRDIQVKVPANLPSTIKNEDKKNVSEDTALFNHNQSQNSKDIKNDNKKITLDNQTQNSHELSSSQSNTEQYGRLNTTPGSYRPLPYATSSTEKAQIKRDTEHKTTEKYEKQNSDIDFEEFAPLAINFNKENLMKSVRMQ